MSRLPNLGRTAVRTGAWLYLLAGTAGRLLLARLRGAFGSSRPRPSDAPSSPSGRRPRVLVVMPYPVVPTDHGGAVRVYNLIRRLSADCDLYLVVLTGGADDAAHRAALESWVARLWLHHPTPDLQPSGRPPPGLLEPPSVALFADSRLALRIRDVVERHRIDVVQLEHTEMAQYRWAAGSARVVLVAQDVSCRSFQRRRRLGLPQRYPASLKFGATFRDWMALLRFEVAACRGVDRVHAMSAADAAYLARLLPDGDRRLRVVPNGVDCAWYQPAESAPERRGVLLAGNFHTLPNLDACEYFMHQVWPEVRRLRPDAEVSLVGAAMPPRLYDRHGRDGVTVTGAVPEMREVYHRHRVLVAPLRAGSGTRVKLLEAFAAGLPVVSTTLGAEGIDCADGEHLLLADDPAGLARAVDRLLGDPGLAARLSVNAMRLARERYDWAASARAHLDDLRELMPAAAPEPAEPNPVGDPAPRIFASSVSGDIAVSVIIPCYRGGAMLERCLGAIARQVCSQPFEVVCLDSGSPPADLAVMQVSGARVHAIDNRLFNHGLTRDLGAGLAVGEVLAFLNQDAIPADDTWLENLTAPLFAADPPAAVQGAMLDFSPEEAPVRPFYWGTCGPRFYFTREMRRWVERYPGPSFSTVNAAIRREVWERHPFGWAPIMEDKKWQRTALEAGLRIAAAPDARVHHSHGYDLRSLLARCRNEGYGWRLLGQRYTAGDALRDLWAPRRWREAAGAVLRQRPRMTAAEAFYPWLRPLALWDGNRRQTRQTYPCPRTSRSQVAIQSGP